MNELATNFNVHDHLKDKTVEELQQIMEADRLPYAVAVINLTGSLNVGIIIRTACNLGAERVIVFGRRKYDARSCVGSHNYIPVERVDGFVDNRAPDPELVPERFADVMKKFRYFPVFLETGSSQPITDLRRFRGPRQDGLKPCLVFGAEGTGIPESITSQGTTFTIPQLGVIRSYNVSAAASIALWEMYKGLSQ
jgi:tRNA G18 (ribose-2'-O)-methylase SpoU